MEVFNQYDKKIMKDHPEFFKAAEGLRAAILDFDHDVDDDYLPDEQRIMSDDEPLVRSNAVSSVMREYKAAFGAWPAPGSSRHKPVLDIDIPHLYIPSTTPGHAHLILDTPLPWYKYEELLKLLGECGILEAGYVSASIERKCTWIRTPWTKKKESNDPL